MQMGTEEMAQWIREFAYIFSPHRKLTMAVCVSVTSALWFLRFAPHELSPRVSQSLCHWDTVENGRAGHWTRVLNGCLLHVHTFTHRNVQMNISQRAVQWEGLCSECLCISCTFPSSDLCPPHTDFIPVPVPISTS